jgi:hypothetical protein
MIQVVKILHNERSMVFISFLIGMGLVIMMFHKPFLTRKTLALPIFDIVKRTVSIDEKCYQYSAEDATCDLPSFK